MAFGSIGSPSTDLSGMTNALASARAYKRGSFQFTQPEIEQNVGLAQGGITRANQGRFREFAGALRGRSGAYKTQMLKAMANDMTATGSSALTGMRLQFGQYNKGAGERESAFDTSQLWQGFTGEYNLANTRISQEQLMYERQRQAEADKQAKRNQTLNNIFSGVGAVAGFFAGGPAGAAAGAGLGRSLGGGVNEPAGGAMIRYGAGAEGLGPTTGRALIGENGPELKYNMNSGKFELVGSGGPRVVQTNEDAIIPRAAAPLNILQQRISERRGERRGQMNAAYGNMTRKLGG